MSEIGSRVNPTMAPQRTTKFHFNRIHTVVELLLRRSTPTNVPIFCLHEPTTGCNLRCPACPTGAGLINVKETATLEDYELVCQEFGQYLEVYYLFNWGEATMSRQLPAILNRLGREPFNVHMASNFSLPVSDQLIDTIATMPRLNIQIDVDGVTQETHERSRVRSKLSIVLENARRLSERVKQSSTPPLEISFGFLNFDYNAGEREAVRKMAAELGFKFSPIGEPLSAGQTPTRGEIALEPDFGCTWLYSSILPSPKLSRIAPCCGVWDGKLMSPRESGQSLHEVFMRDDLFKQRRERDAEFSGLPAETRIDFLQENIAKEEGMALLQAKSDEDICGRCSMGNSYQAKLPRIWHGAVASLAHLSQTDSKTAAARLGKFARNVASSSPTRDPRLVDRLIAALEMPPAQQRTIGAYQQFSALLQAT